ncbi:MAG: PHP domain-containing protein [bacterium]|nr:PHP domain-containing protein [bacterium]
MNPLHRRLLTGLFSALILLALTGTAMAGAAGGTERKPYRGVIHVHTTYSTGELTAREIVQKAKEAGIQIVVFTDHDLVRVSWGLPPFRNLISRQVDARPSVLQIGVEKYFNDIEELQRQNPNMVILPAIETAPFYYSTGNPILGELTIHDWRRHLLLLGLGRKAVQDLPIPNNGWSTRYFWNLLPGTILYLIPLFFSLVLLLFRGITRWVGLVIFLVALIGALDAHPFKSSPFSPQAGPQGVRPYQEIINYTEEKGGFALWAHQGSLLTNQKVGPAIMKTAPHSEVLIKTTGYWGFDAIYEDRFKASHPGEEWDKILVGFLNGLRPRPIWGYGGLDFHSEQELGGRKRLGNITNVFLMEEISEDAFLRSLINGRFYTVRGYTDARLQLEEFRILSPDEKTSESLGGTVRFNGPPRVRFEINTQNGASVKVRARLIRMGAVVRIFEGMTPLRVDFSDTDEIPQQRFYYRLDVKGMQQIKVIDGEHLLTNPVFVRRVDAASGKKETP